MSAPTESSTPVHAERLRIGGRVQGVGYRPFVYRQAVARQLDGWVRNLAGEVELRVQGHPGAVDALVEALIHAAPPLARPRLIERTPVPADDAAGFRIRPSSNAAPPRVHVPPDFFACDDCLREMRDPGDRRYRYPFINCTQCGPRYTLIAALPYDRPATSMADFALCPACRREYDDPGDRRFHAEPIACPACGPRLYTETGTRGDAALQAALATLGNGGIVAVKGIGGYHLLCDAGDAAAVAALRRRKARPAKPLAVMFPLRGDDGLAAVREQLVPTSAEATALRSPQRPIVLVRRRRDGTLPPNLAPGLDELGAMLPYSPLHALLLDGLGRPVVATSGNISGEPVLTDPGEAERRLAGVADHFLHHDRPILRPADDPVVRAARGSLRPLRLGRGTAPLELELPFSLERPTLAVGGHMKNSVALAWDRRIVLSPHVGELDSPRGQATFEQVLTDLQRLYGVEAERVVADAHPGYASRRWAERSGLPLTTTYHHFAHAAGLYGEHRGEGDWLVFTWDGVGLGPDGTLWGGEALYGRPGRWRRVGALRPFRLPGGEKAARAPWRCALGALWELGEHWTGAPVETDLLHQAWHRGVNTPTTTAAGRLFDAAAALSGVCSEASFEGEGPMQLEQCARRPDSPPPPPPLEARDGVLWLDWGPLLLELPRRPAAEAAGHFHAVLAAGIATMATRIAAQFPVTAVGLSGGVFQNRLLSELSADAVEAGGLPVRLHETVPCNDGGLCYGQLHEAAGQWRHGPQTQPTVVKP